MQKLSLTRANLHAPCWTKNREHAPCWTNETRASQTINTVRVDQHAPCHSENQRTRLSCTARVPDPCDAKQRTRPLCTVRAPDPCSAKSSATARAAAPCAEGNSLARSVPMTRAALFLLFLGALLTPGRWSSTRNQMLLHPKLKWTSPKPNHYHITSILPSIHSCKLIKP